MFLSLLLLKLVEHAEQVFAQLGGATSHRSLALALLRKDPTSSAQEGALREAALHVAHFADALAEEFKHEVGPRLRHLLLGEDLDGWFLAHLLHLLDHLVHRKGWRVFVSVAFPANLLLGRGDLRQAFSA